MRLQQFDLNLLVALDALLREASVSRAADQLAFSQPTISNILVRLRDYFGDELLVPAGRSLKLTPFGESLRKQVEQNLVATRTLLMRRPSFDPAAATQEIVILASTYVVSLIVPEVSRRLAREAPGMTLRVASGASDAQVLGAFDGTRISLLLVPPFRAHDGHPSELLFEEPLVCVVAADNKKVGKKLTLDHLRRLPHVLIRFGAFTETPHTKLLRDIGYNGRVPVYASNFEMLPDFVAGTDRVALVPRTLAKAAAKRLPLRLFDPPVPVPNLVELIQWHSSVDDEPAVLWIRRLLHDAAAKLIA